MSIPLSLQQILSMANTPPGKKAPVVVPDATDTKGGLAQQLEDLASAQDQRSQENLWRSFFGGYQEDPQATQQLQLGRAQADSSKQNVSRAKFLRGSK